MIGGIGMNINTPEFRELVRQDDPQGNFCQFCGKLNDNWDDCGWWYFWPNSAVKVGRVACKACDKGEPGRRHRGRYGVGER